MATLSRTAVRVLTAGSAQPWINQTSVRTTMIMKRVFPPPLAKLGKTAHLKRLQFVYERENTLNQRIPDITVVLTEYVDGVGDVGDVVTVKARMARHELLLPGLAVYYTSENLAKYTNMTISELESRTLFIPMNEKRQSPLTKTHVRVALRLMGVELTDDCIHLPEETIHSDSREPFNIDILMNRVFTAHVRAQIYPYQLDATGKSLPPPAPP